MNNPSSTNILGFNALDPNSITQNKKSLPYPLHALIICNNKDLQQGLSTYCSPISNLKIEFSKNLVERLELYNLVILVSDDNNSIIKPIIEKLTVSDIQFIILGDSINNDLIRIAIHHNVNDIISVKDIENELYNALLGSTDALINKSKIAPVFSIINGKPGSGASFIASCLGEISANLSDDEIALIDADLNYGSLSDTFNFEPNYFITDALQELEQLDTTAVKGMMLKRGNLNLLASRPYTQLNMNGNELSQLPQLLWKIKLNHDLVLIDLSRGLESSTLPLLHISDNILIVVQQNILSLRETKALIQQLTTSLGISIDKLHIIVNRYTQKENNISITDIKKVLDVESVYMVSNNYELANEGINSGSPILKVANHKTIQTEISHIIRSLFPIDIPLEKKSLLTKLFGR